MGKQRKEECTCPRCRLGHIPPEYTFGGMVPPPSEPEEDAERKLERIREILND